MTVQQLIDKQAFQLVHDGEIENEIASTYCCDLLSIAMSRLPAKAAWVTVMGNINTIAVAVLAECSCVILAEGVTCDEVMLEKARQQGITVFSTELPVFEAAVLVDGFLKRG